MAIAGMVIFSSCGDSAKKPSKESANGIIEYYNNSLDILKKTHTVKDMEKVMDYMAKKRQLPNGTTLQNARNNISISPMKPHAISWSDSSKVFHPGDCFMQGAKDSLTMAYAAYSKAGNQFILNYQAFGDYLKAEDYKDDSWAKGDALIGENTKLFEEIMTSRNQIYAIITPLADAAEIVILQDSPLKNHILAGKGIFSSMDIMVEIYAQDSVDTAAYDAAYSTLEAKVEEAKKIEAVEGQEPAMASFSKFLTATEGFMGVLRKSRRDNSYTQDGFDDLQYKYKGTISEYNYFVN